MVDGLDEPVAPAFLESHVLEEHLFLLVALQLGDVGLGLRADDEHLGILATDSPGHSLGVGIACRGAGVVHVAHIQDWLGREQEHALGGGLLILRVKGHRACALALEQSLTISLQNVKLDACLLVASHLGSLLHLLHTALHRLQVLELQLGVNDFLVPHRVDAAIHMHDVAVVEAAQHMDDGVTLAYVGQELVAQPLALAGSLDQPGDVHDVTHGGHDTARVDQFGQLGEPLVGHGHLAQLRVDGAEGEIGRLCLGAGQAVEKG